MSISVVFDNIENNLLMYDQIVKTTVRYDTDEFGDSIKDRYIKQLELFSSLLEE
jgi:hemerythrin-like domain-containing protein